MKRAFVIVLDSVGIGAMPDWSDYDSEPGNTLCHISNAVGGISLPHLEKMGLGNIASIKGVKRVTSPMASFGKAPLTTVGKDTTAGHWEMMGIVLQQGFPTYPQGFPADFVAKLETSFGTKILGKIPASGTAIIDALGEEHQKTKYPIVYTSGDSVVQIACHEELYSHEELYELCEKARGVCQGKYGVGRVIARPFKGIPGNFQRTPYRKDYSLLPPKPNVLSLLKERKIPVIGVGKISDIFAGEDISISYPVKGNDLCFDTCVDLAKKEPSGFVFVNLVDFDMLYGHRNDAFGYAKALEKFDKKLPLLLDVLMDEDLLIITADHGNDPTTKSTDHNREYVPVLSYEKGKKGEDLATLSTMADIGGKVFTWLTEENSPFGTGW